MSQFDIRKWRNQLNESTGQNKRMSEQEKKETLESVSRFNELGKNIYKTQEISELVENIKTMAENASRMAIEETADWFDAVSVKRDTKAIGESIKVFEGTFREISTLQQRLESVFEDIGGKLGKYYEIKELNEEDVEAPEGEEDLENADELTDKQKEYQLLFKKVLAKEFDVESPADLDDEQKKKFFAMIKYKNAMDKKEGKFNNKFQKQVNEAYKKLNKAVRK